MKMWPALLGAILVLLPGTVVVMLAQDHASGDPAARGVVDTLDRLIQNRFRSNEGSFGVSRIPLIYGHDGVRVLGGTPQERKSLDEVNSAGRPHMLYFLHLNPPPPSKAQVGNRIIAYTRAMKDSPTPAVVELTKTLNSGSATPPIIRTASTSSRFALDRETAAHSLKLLKDRVEQLGIQSSPEVKRGRLIESEKDGWLVAIRPVIANDKTCISCHTRSRQGDILGAMIYAVRSGNPATN